MRIVAFRKRLNIAKIREVLTMTKVGQLFEDEKQKYAQEYAQEYVQKKH